MAHTNDKFGRLTIAQHQAYQRRDWRFQRIGRVGLLVLIGLALTGVFGQGGFSRVSLQTDQVLVRYDRFLRLDALARFQLSLTAAAQGSVTRVSIAAKDLVGVRMTEISPEPAEVSTGPGRITYSFQVDETGGQIIFYAVPRRPGVLRLRLTVDQGPELQLWQFVWP